MTGRSDHIDRTLEVQHPVTFAAASDSVSTIEIRRFRLNAEGHVAVIGRPDDEVQCPVNMIGASGHPELCLVKGYNGSISLGLYL